MGTNITHIKLVMALTEYDRRQQKRKGYNRYALAQYFEALAWAEDRAAKTGCSLEVALGEAFHDPILSFIGKRTGLTLVPSNHLIRPE
jgi:hypothetical protein